MVTTSSKINHSQKVADELMHLLADTYTLYLKTQNYHWNVRGPLFPQLHKLFEEQYIELSSAIDVIAERIRALEASTPASFSAFLKLASLKEESRTKVSATDMIKNLLHDHDVLAKSLLHILEKAEEAQDEGTVDLLTERLRAHEKTAWMLRSSLE
jgi:starvation-inducible DNA-binding protein